MDRPETTDVECFDVVVIGAGPAGETAAGRLAEKGGRSVAIVERELVGGECSFYACMPSKALLRPQELLGEVGRVPGVGIHEIGVAGVGRRTNRGLDVGAVLARRDQVISGLDDSGQLPWLESRGIELIRGEGRIVGEREVEVGARRLRAREAVVVAVGSKPLIPPVEGLEEVAVWSTREATTAYEVPRRLVVLGGGPVGVEMAQAWRSLGAEVAVLEAASRLLPSEEPFAGEELRQAFTEIGIAMHLGQSLSSAERAGAIGEEDEEVLLTLEDGRQLRCDRVLVAVGRRPATGGLGLESVGLTRGEPVEVDEHMRATSSSWLYAVGDVNGMAPLTHVGKYQARVAADHILGEDAKLRDVGGAPPRVVFTDPQVAAVGWTLQGAREHNLRARAVDVETSGTPGASFHGRGTRGTTRFVVDAEREVVVGATFVGFEVAEMLQAATVAIAGEVPLSRLAHAIAPFPTRSELWLKLLEAYGEHYTG